MLTSRTKSTPSLDRVEALVVYADALFEDKSYLRAEVNSLCWLCIVSDSAFMLIADGLTCMAGNLSRGPAGVSAGDKR